MSASACREAPLKGMLGGDGVDLKLVIPAQVRLSTAELVIQFFLEAELPLGLRSG
jgi:hypothetical protein